MVSLRIRSETSSATLYLSFEFHVKYEDSLLGVVHRMKASDAVGVSAIVSKNDASEVLTSPKVLLRLLEPLKKTNEAALFFRQGSETISAMSFHHSDSEANAASSSNNAVLQAVSASSLKTETAIGCDEFAEYEFRDDRNLADHDDAPESVNKEVFLVFPIKEAKAMLNFCSHAHSDQELQASLSFHWGGKPMLLETSTEAFSAELVLATLDHHLLARISNGADRGEKQ